MRREIEKLLVRTDWQINSLERTLNNEMESMKERAEIGDVNYVKVTCERIEQIRNELNVYKSYKYELEGILKMELRNENICNISSWKPYR